MVRVNIWPLLLLWPFGFTTVCTTVQASLLLRYIAVSCLLLHCAFIDSFVDKLQFVIGRWVLHRWVVDRWAIDKWVIDRRVTDRWVVDGWVTDRWVIDRRVIDRWVIDRWLIDRLVVDRWVIDRQVIDRWVIDRWVVDRWVVDRVGVAGCWLRRTPVVATVVMRLTSLSSQRLSQHDTAHCEDSSSSSLMHLYSRWHWMK